MNELQLNIQQGAGTIKANFEEIETQLREKMKEYDGIVFTEETKDIAKVEIASLRKLVKSIGEKRIEVKKACLVPYDEFETKVKALTVLIDKPIMLIDKQLQVFEENRVKEKQAKIKDIYIEFAEGVQDYIPLEKIYNKKWENVATTVKSIKQDITEAADGVRAAVLTIQGMNSDAVPAALTKYKQSLSLTDAISYVNNYEAQKQEIVRKEAERREAEKERARIAEIERVRAEERAQIAKEAQAQKELERAKVEELTYPSPVQETKVNVEREAEPFENGFDALPFETPSTVTVKYRIVALPAEIKELETLMNSIGICFEKEVLN